MLHRDPRETVNPPIDADDEMHLWAEHVLHPEQAVDIEYPKEFYDVFKVLDMGAKKYSPNGWLIAENMNSKDNFSSICRHSAKVWAGEELDEESGLSHHLHAACRHLMEYTRKQRGIK